MPDRSHASAYRTGVDEHGYEFENPSAKGLFIVMIGLSIALAGILFATLGVYRLFMDIRTFEAPVTRVPLKAQEKFPGPRLQIDPHEDWQTLYDRQQRKLHSYGLINQRKGTVRVPIDRAFQMLLERNQLPIRGEKTEKKATITPLELQKARAQEGSDGQEE